MNLVILTGNLGADPNVHKFENEDKLVTFSLATTERFKDREGEKKERTDWHNIVIRKGLADVAEQHLKKGNKITVMGRINYREHKKDDGTFINRTEIFVEKLEML